MTFHIIVCGWFESTPAEAPRAGMRSAFVKPTATRLRLASLSCLAGVGKKHLLVLLCENPRDLREIIFENLRDLRETLLSNPY